MKISKRKLTKEEKKNILQRAQEIIDERYLFTRIEIEINDVEEILKIMEETKPPIPIEIATLDYVERYGF